MNSGIKNLNEFAQREQNQYNSLVSVILPTYSDIEYLERSVESVYNQSYSNLELIIIDGNQNDCLKDIIKKSNWIVYESQEPKGVAAARNRGIELSQGKFISFIDADDRWLTNKTTQQMEFLTSGYDIVYSDEFRMKHGSKYRFQSLTPSDSLDLWENHFINGGVPLRTVSVRSFCFNDHVFCEDLKMSEDPHLWTRMLKDYRTKRINKPLAIKYVRENSLTEDYISLYENEIKAAIDLSNQYSDLRRLLVARLLKSEFTLAINLLTDNQEAKARKKLKCLAKRNYRIHIVFPLLVLSISPLNSKHIFKKLEILVNKIR